MWHARVARASIEIRPQSNTQWMERAKCLRAGTENFWLKASRPRPLEYEAILDKWCRQCPVRPECLLRVIKQEIELRYTSRGVEGGCTPAERKLLRRYIREDKLCVTQAVWRFLNNHPMSKKPVKKTTDLTVLLYYPSGEVYTRRKAKTSHGANIIIRREQNLRPDLPLIGVVKKANGQIVDVKFPPSTERDQQQKNPSQ